MASTARQQAWEEAAKRSDGLAVGLFAFLAQPSRAERDHNCAEHSLGFRRHERRGFRCGICRRVLKWRDPETS